MRLKLSLLFAFIVTYSWSQGSTKTFTGNGTFLVPAGVTNVTVEAWGGGGSGGGASGAPLLLGRGAAGGGGGAYARNNIVVTPGATLNVVVASQTAGTTGAGTAGGNSTITGFESSILAAGGSGGDANNAGGSPIGGAGGTTAGSAGSTKVAGVNGGNGNSWNLLGLLLSSGAGGAGANFGGAGGTAVSGLLLSNAPGNAGSPAGGAGSGAINSALGAAQIGGAGAAGRITITYSCANFSLTSTAATNVCGSTGTTSIVTLTGSAASLPVGSYVVTYNRSSPSVTGLTANLTVTTAGTGTFTAVGLTAAGSSTITITKLTSESCSSNITTNNTAIVAVSPATVGGTVSGGLTVCTGNLSGVLTLSGHTGSVLKWQSSVSPFSTWTDIANTTTTYTSGVLTQTTQFRAVVQSGGCVAVNSAATIVTVSPATVGGTVSGGSTVCTGNLSGVLTLSGHTGSVLKWQSSVSPFSTWTDIANTTTTYTSGVLTQTTQFRAVVQNDACAAVNSAATIVTVSPATVGGTVNGGTTINSGSTSGLLTLSGHTGSVIKWQSSVSPFSTWTDIANTNTTYTSGVLTQTTQFRAVVQSGACLITNSAATTVTVQDLPTITASASAETVCSNPNGNYTTSLSYSATTGSPISYGIVWNSSPANNFAVVSDVALPASPIQIAIPAGTLPETYTGTLTVKNANGGVSTGTTFTVTINETPSIDTTGAIDGVCTSSSLQNATLAYSGISGNPTSYFIDWNGSANAASLADQPSTPFAFSSWGGTINTIEIPANVLPGTYSGIMYIENGVCNQSQVVSITVNQLPSVFVGPTTPDVCYNIEEQSTLLPIYGVTTGSPTTYSITWSSSPSNSFAAVSDVEFSSDPIEILVPAETEPGTYTGTVTVKNANGCVSPGSSFTVTVDEPLSIALYGILSECESSNSQIAQPLTYKFYGSPTSYYIDWDQAANDALLEDQPNTPHNFHTSGEFESIDSIVISANAHPGNYAGTLFVANANCVASSPIYMTISALDKTPIVGDITPGPEGSVVLSGLPEGSWTILSNPEGVNKYGTGENTVITGLATGEYTFTVNGDVNCRSLPSEVVVIPNAPEAPTIALAASAENVCIGDFSGGEVTTLSYSGTTGEPVTYSIVWNSSPVNGFEEISNAVLPASPISISLPLGVEEGTYTGTLTVKNASGIASSPGSVFNLVVGYRPVIISSGTINPIVTSTNAQNAVLAYNLITANPSSYYIDWDQSANDALLQDQSNTSYVFNENGGSINTIAIPANVPAGTYSGTMYFVNDSPCIGSKPISIVINDAVPTIALASSTENVCGNLGYNETQTTLSYKGTTGEPVTYSIVWNSSPENNFEAVENAVLPSSPITITVPEDTLEGTYSGTLTVKNANGISSVGSTFNLRIGLTPAIIIYEPINPVCASTNSQNATLPYNGTESNPTSYFIDWDETANNALLQDQASTPVTLDHNGGTIDSIIISANAQAGSYSGTLHLVEGFCTGSVPISIVINPSPKVPIIGEITPATNEDPTGSIAFSGLPSGTNWGLVLLSGGQQDFVTGGNTESVVIDQFPPGDYKFRVFYLDTNCSSDFTETVIVPSITWKKPTSKDTTTGTTDLKSAGNSITVGIDNKVINVEAPNQIIKEVFVFDVSGNLLYKKNKVSDSKLVIADLRSSNQVLVVRVVLNNNQSEVKKVIY